MKKLLTVTGLLLVFSLATAQAPAFSWVKPLVAAPGGIVFSEQTNLVAADGLGNVYAAGLFAGTVDFDPGPGVFNMTTAALRSVFVMKLDSTGNLVWCRQVGDTGSTNITGIALTPAGHLLLTGTFSAANDFDPGTGVYTLPMNGVRNGYVLKLDTAGNFVWARAFGNVTYNNMQVAYGTADAAGNVLITAPFSGSIDADPGPGVFNLNAPPGFSDVCIIKLDAAGNLVWAKQLEGGSGLTAHSIAADGAGNVFIGGHFIGSFDFDPGAGINTMTSVNGSLDVFAMKLDAAGNFQWAHRFGAAESERLRSLVCDNNNNLLLSGSFGGTVDFDPGSGIQNLTGDTDPVTPDLFVVKLSNAGSYTWARNWAHPGGLMGFNITTDRDDAVYMTGKFTGTIDLDPDTAVSPVTSVNTSGLTDLFVLKLNSAGNFSWGVAAGGTGYADSYTIAVDPLYHVFTYGMFSGTMDFDPGPGVFSLPAVNNYNMYVHRLKQPLFVGQPETNPENAFVIYPNPGTGIFNLVSADAAEQVTVFDMQGREVFVMQPQAANVSIDLRHFSAGIYSVHLRTGRGTAVKRIVLHGQ